MFCKECGAEIDDDAKFCKECGTQLNNEIKTNEIKKVEVEEKIIKKAEISSAIYLIPLVVGLITLIFFIGLFFIFLAIIFYFKAGNAELIITNKHLIGKAGVISSEQMQIPLNMVNTVSYEKGFFGKMFGYGTIKITSQVEDCVFENVKDVEEFHRILLSEISKFDDNRMIKQANYISKALN